MHGKWLKISTIIAVSVVVLVLALIILAKTLITPELIRSAVLPAAEDFLHRPVDLERIEVGLFSGISCRGLVIGERHGDDNFIEAETLVLRYRFWPLLFGRVALNEATLNGPVIRITRNADGSFNFGDLLGPSGNAPEETAAAADREDGSPVDLLVTHLTVANGRIEFTDRAVRPGQAVVTRLDALNLSAQALSTRKAFPVTVDFLLNGAPVTWDGSVDPARKGYAGQLQVAGLSAGPLVPYLGEALPGQLRTMQFDADLRLAGDPQALTSRGAVLWDKIGLTLKALPEAPIENARLKLDHDLTLELEQKHVTIRSLRAAYNRVVLEAQDGRVDYSAAPQLDIELRLPQLSVPDLVASLPPGLTGEMADFAPSGQVEGKMHLSGSASSPETLIADGSLSLRQAGLRVGHLEPRLSGTVHLENDELSGQKMQLDVAGSRFFFDLAARRLFDEVKYAATDIQSGDVDFAAFLPPEKAAAGSSATNAAGATGGAEESESQTGPVELPLEMDGKIRVAEGRYKGLGLKDVRLDWQLSNNVIRFRNIGAAAASGSLHGKAVIDLGRKEPTYDANVQLKEVDANEIVTAFAPRAADTVFGRLDLSMNLRGSGTQPNAVKRNLLGGGRFAIRQGELTGAGIMQGLAAFLDLDDLRVLRFDLGEGTFNIRGGGVFLDASFDGSKARLLPRGRIGLDQSLDLSVKAFLSPENTKKLAGKGTLGEVIADDQGWGLVPLRIVGTLTDPSVSMDRQALAEQVKKGAERKLREKLQEKILEEVGESPGDGEEDPAKKLLKDTLRGLFGN